MLTKKSLICIWILLSTTFSTCYSQNFIYNPTITIHTKLKTFYGKPTLLIMVRDLDRQITLPYLFDITQGDNYWVISPHCKNYLIEAANLQINVYHPRLNIFTRHKINNICHLESHGRILRNESMNVIIHGKITSNRRTFTCNVSQYPSTILTTNISNSF